MKSSFIPQNGDKSNMVSEALKNSKLLSCCFLLALENKKVRVADIASHLGKSHAQIFQLLNRLNHLGILKKVPKKSIFIFNPEYEKETVDIFKKEGLEKVNEK